ncbi:MAG: isoprenylcysteine carboxylmethyltransferase family protein [Polyangia bacterium]
MELAFTLPLFTALLVLVGLTRLAELLLSQRNRRRMRAHGALAVREPHFGAMVLLHVAILVGAGVETWGTRRAPVSGLAAGMLILLAAAIALRWWVIASLGPHWNVAIMDSIAEQNRQRQGLTVVCQGPFRWIRHPNYVAVFVELLALPLVHAAWFTAVLGSAAHVWVLCHRVRSEEAVLLGHPSYQAAMADKPRFVPRPLSTAIKGVYAFIRLGRPLFLLGGFVLYGLGTAVAKAQGQSIDPSAYLLGQAMVTAFQLTTHYANDFFDYEADRANDTPTRWSGGSRVLPRGEVPRVAALAGALAAAGAGIVAMLVLASRHTGPLLVPIALAILVLSWLYSAPPLRLHSTGWGELDAVMVVTALVPFFAFYLQAPGLIGWTTLLLAVFPPCCLQFAMLLAVGVPDAAGDLLVGKRTLVLRLGAARALRWHLIALAVAYAVLPILVAAGLPLAVGLAAALLAPLAVWRILHARGGQALRPGNWEALTFWSVALLTLTAAAELTGFLLL